MKGLISVCQVLTCQAAQTLGRERPWDTQNECSQKGPFLSQQALVSLSHLRVHPHFILIFPGKALSPSGLSPSSWPSAVPGAPGPQGAGCSLCLTCLSSPSPFHTSSLRCCCDSLTLRRYQSEWKKPNQAPGCASLYIFYSDSQA